MRQQPASDDIEISEVYDRESDIYYVTVMTGEPSYVEEHDDVFLIEVGFFTGYPTGFRILNYKKHKNKAFAFKNVFKQICKAAGLRRLQDSEQRQNRIAKFLESVTA